MTKIEQMTMVHTRLQELYTNYLMANQTRDKRRRDKAINDAKKDIANYSPFIPFDIKQVFDKQVGVNSLNYQHADDISQCIEVLEKLIEGEKLEVNNTQEKSYG